MPSDLADLAPDLPLAGIRAAAGRPRCRAASPAGWRAGAAAVRAGRRTGRGRSARPAGWRPCRSRRCRLEGELAADLGSVTVAALRARARATHGCPARPTWPGAAARRRLPPRSRRAMSRRAISARFWPPEAGEEARAWVIEHITDGIVPRARATDRDPARAIWRSARVPERIVEGSFDFRGPDRRLLRGPAAADRRRRQRHVHGRRMDFTVDAGAHRRPSTLDDGSVVITGMGIPGRETTQLEVRRVGAGAVRDILALIDHPPLASCGQGRASRPPMRPAARGSISRSACRCIARSADEEVRIAADATPDAMRAIRAPPSRCGTASSISRSTTSGFDLAGRCRGRGRSAADRGRARTSPRTRRSSAAIGVGGTVDAAALARLAGDLPLELAGARRRGRDARRDGAACARSTSRSTSRRSRSRPVARLAQGRRASPARLDASLRRWPPTRRSRSRRSRCPRRAWRPKASLRLQREPAGAAGADPRAVPVRPRSEGDLTARRDGEQGFDVSVAADTLDLDPLLEAAERTGDGPPEPLRLEAHCRAHAAGRRSELREVSADLVRDPRGLAIGPDPRQSLPNGGGPRADPRAERRSPPPAA